MINMLFTLLIFAISLAGMFGVLFSITGEKDKGNIIFVNCITALILYLFVLQLFSTGLPEDGVFESGIPLINNVEKAGSVKEYILNNTGLFAMDFVQLVVLTMIINWVSNIFVFGNTGFVGKVISRIIIILSGIILYGFVMDLICDNIIIKWLVYGVECIVTGGSILYTPILFLSFITGLKQGNVALLYLVEQFPNTSLGKAISTAITSSIIFLVLLILLESQYGSACNLVRETVNSIEYIGAVFVYIMGIYIMISCLKKKK